MGGQLQLGGPLCDRFSCLFNLYDNQLVIVANMCHIGLGGVGGSLEIEVEIVYIGGEPC